ncbi:MAG: putative membrane protein, partial [uncultured Nocardioidaceae bacterium]
ATASGARRGCRRLRAGLGGARAALPRCAPGGTGAARAQHADFSGIRGRSLRRDRQRLAGCRRCTDPQPDPGCAGRSLRRAGVRARGAGRRRPRRTGHRRSGGAAPRTVGAGRAVRRHGSRRERGGAV